MSNDKRPTVIKRNEIGEVKVYKKNEDGSLTETNDVVKEETFLNLEIATFDLTTLKYNNSNKNKLIN